MGQGCIKLIETAVVLAGAIRGEAGEATGTVVAGAASAVASLQGAFIPGWTEPEFKS